jgi:hypothetical protein
VYDINPSPKENPMLKSNAYAYREAALAAPRQVWLAGLGAAVVTRDWVQKEAGPAFKSLVKQGTTVESRAIRFVGDRIESSMARANTLWRHGRSTLESAVKGAAEQAVAIAQHAVPKSLPKLELPFAKPTATRAAPARRAKKAARVPAARKRRAVKAAKR